MTIPGNSPRSIQEQNSYQCIASAIAFMREHYREQPNLDAIAAHVHLSKHHFQRLFTQWAGISPKRFGQYLTVEYAKSQISATQNLLDLSLTTGLSSPGRLHDLFVNLEAMSPGEYKGGGAGLDIQYGVHLTPFGDCLLATTTRGICTLQFLDVCQEMNVEEILHQEFPSAEFQNTPDVTGRLCDRIFQPLSDSSTSLSLHVKGTNFQIQVWRALLNIPFSGITTYQDLATLMERPTAARAVGNAVGKNPVGYLIPCHRVLRRSGELGGYRWGVERKAALVAWEASQGQVRKEAQ